MNYTRTEQPTNTSPITWALLAIIILLALAEMLWLALTRYHGYNTLAFDLGLMSQAIWSATQGQPLIFTAEGVAMSRLARNVEFFYFLLAPLYWLRPSPTTLIIFQAVLYALGALPLYRLAQRHWQNDLLALLAPSLYLFYPVAQTAVLFEFHGDTLAMPLLLFAIESLDRGAWRSYAFWLLLALSCKFYVAASVAGLGLLLWLRGQRRVGGYTMLVSVLWGGLTFWGIRALFVLPEAIIDNSTTVTYLATSYLNCCFGQVEDIANSLLPRFIIALIIYIPILMALNKQSLGWLLPGTLIIVPVLLSAGPGPSYDYRYHHYAIAVPFLVMAIVMGGAELRRKQLHFPPLPGKKNFFPWQMRLIISLMLTLGLNALFVDTPLNPQFYERAPGSGMGLTKSGFLVSERDRFKDEWLAAHAPPQAALLTNKQIGLRLVNRERLYIASLLPQERWPQVLNKTEYAIFDALYDFALADGQGFVYHGGVADNHASIQAVMQSGRFQLLAGQDGLLLFGRTGEGLQQRVAINPSPPSTYSSPIQFNDEITLLDIQIATISRRQFQATFTWQAQESLTDSPPLIAVTHVAGLSHMRLVHLPTLALMPTPEWEAEMIVQESFEFTLPPETPAGAYQLTTGWYDSHNLFAAQTDERSLVGKVIPVAIIQVE